MNIEGIIHDTPENKIIPFTVDYNNKEYAGIAKGSAMPFNTLFEIELSGNNFTIQAEGNGDGTYTWRAHNGGTPLIEVTPQIGKEIEKYFDI